MFPLLDAPQCLAAGEEAKWKTRVEQSSSELSTAEPDGWKPHCIHDTSSFMTQESFSCTTTPKEQGVLHTFVEKLLKNVTRRPAVEATNSR